TSIKYNVGSVYNYLTLFAMVSFFLRQLAMKGLKDVTDDWRWQRVFGQVAILVLMGTYLALVDDDASSSMDNLAGIMLATMVAVNIWSA
ncbi:hypothetical protein BDL97_01G175100, partial [Sphagnum fallax]